MSKRLAKLGVGVLFGSMYIALFWGLPWAGAPHMECTYGQFVFVVHLVFAIMIWGIWGFIKLSDINHGHP